MFIIYTKNDILFKNKYSAKKSFFHYLYHFCFYFLILLIYFSPVILIGHFRHRYVCDCNGTSYDILLKFRGSIKNMSVPKLPLYKLTVLNFKPFILGDNKYYFIMYNLLNFQYMLVCYLKMFK